MSSAYYSLRLMWHGHRGDWSCGPVHIELASRPEILSVIGVSEIEFTPEVNVARVRVACDRWRDMSQPERAAVSAWLAERSSQVRHLLNL